MLGYWASPYSPARMNRCPRTTATYARFSANTHAAVLTTGVLVRALLLPYVHEPPTPCAHIGVRVCSCRTHQSVSARRCYRYNGPRMLYPALRACNLVCAVAPLYKRGLRFARGPRLRPHLPMRGTTAQEIIASACAFVSFVCDCVSSVPK